jgi:hypothetical protein
MANTPNIDLVKPAGTDHALVSVINSNSDKIDTFAGTTNAAITALTPIASKSFGSIDELNQYGNSVINSVTFTSTGTARSNLPFASDGTMVISGDGNYMHVTCYRANGECYTRHKNNGTWDAGWQQLALKSDVDALAKSLGTVSATARTFTITNNSRIVLTFFCVSSSVNDAIYTVSASSSGLIHYVKIGGGSVVTITSSTNSIQLSSTVNINMFATIYAGNITEVTS